MFLALLLFVPYLTVLVLAMVFALTFHPLYLRILRALNNRESIAALITLFIVVTVIVVPSFFIGRQIVVEAQDFYVSLVSSEKSLEYAERTIEMIEYYTGTDISSNVVQTLDIAQYAGPVLK
jgi:predicted PurR-regulated permease PerM